MIKEVLVLCGGYGRRLGELTQKNPKSLVNLAGKPILSHSLSLLKEELSPKRFVLLTGYLGDQIKDYFGNGKRLGMRIDYVEGQIGEVGDDSFLIRNIFQANKRMNSPWYWASSSDYLFSREFLRFVRRQPPPGEGEVAQVFFKKRKRGKHQIKLAADSLVEIGRRIDGEVEGSRSFYAFSKKAISEIDPEGLDSVNAFLNELTKIGKVRVICHGYWLMDIDTPDDLREARLWLSEHPDYSRSRAPIR